VVVKAPSNAGDFFSPGEFLKPVFRDAFFAIEGSGDLAENCAGGVGIVAEVDGFKCAFFERGGRFKSPEGGFEGFDNIAGAAYIEF
jgi:hypothetical protein